MPFRAVWSLAALVGATLKLGIVWLLADTLNALMAISNLVALALLSPLVFKISKEFFEPEANLKITRSSGINNVGGDLSSRQHPSSGFKISHRICEVDNAAWF